MKTRVAVLSTLLIAFAVACGGGGHHNPPPSGGGGGTTGNGGGGGSQPPAKKIALLQSSARPGSHVFGQLQKTTAINLNPLSWLVQPAYAQVVQTVSVAQSVDGSCKLSPVGFSGSISVLVFGLGQKDNDKCNSDWFNDSDGQVAADNATTGFRIWGNGNLTSILVSVDKGTQINTPVPVKLWARRNGTILPTGLSCTLPAGQDELACTLAGTFAAQEGDRIIATFTLTDPSNRLVNLYVGSPKVLP